jgi:[ribosomal protein S5]-alanine N-acetyltransferase
MSATPLVPIALSSPRLELLLESTQDVLARIDALPPEDRAQVSPAWLEQLAASTPSPWTHAFAIVERASGAVVGSCGFKEPPNESGAVEIAYRVEPDHRGRGFAKEAAAALVGFACASGARSVRAHTLPEEGPSTSVLVSCGFRKAREVVDPEDGVVWRWEHSGAS